MADEFGTWGTYRHIRLEQLADGVYAAIATRDGAAYSNAVIVDLGDQTLVFDALATVPAGEELRQATEEVTGRPAAYLILSHVHSDHWGGAQAFIPPAAMIATGAVRQAMQPSVEEQLQLKADPSDWVAEVAGQRARLETETDPRWRTSLAASINRAEQALAALPLFEPRLPDLTFDRRLVFHGSRRRAELVTEGRGHSDSDAYLVLPDDGIIALGDLGFFACQPYMADCEPVAWLRQSGALADSGASVFVPGHGPVGSRADLARQSEYISALDALVAGVVQGGGSEAAALALRLPAQFDRWLTEGMARFEANVRSAYQRLSRQRPERRP